MDTVANRAQISLARIWLPPLPEAEHLPCPLQQGGRRVDGIGVQRRAGAVDGFHDHRQGMGAQGGGIGAGFQLVGPRRRQRVGLGQGDLHFVVPVEPQRAAEPENRSFRHAALLRQGRDGQILRFLGMAGQVIGHHPARAGQLAVARAQQFPEITRIHGWYSFGGTHPGGAPYK